MELFTVSLPSSLQHELEKLTNMLIERANEDLHMEASAELAAAIDFRIVSDHQLRCEASLPVFELKQHGAAVFKTSSNTIAEFVINELEPEMLSAIIRKKYCGRVSLDTAVIEKYCHNLMYGKECDGLGAKFHDADRNRRKSKVADELEMYLHDNTNLNLDGFTTFRLMSYRKELAELVEYALDEYMLDKQYQEFISLLKYFVFLQETKVTMVHLLHKDGHEFALYNDSFKPLEPKPRADRIVAEMLETEMNIEDMVISSLISISPKHIKIHTRQPEMQVIRTIQMIFEDRVTVCVQCPSCSSSLDELIQP